MGELRQFRLPDVGEGLTEGEILSWLVSVGDTVTVNQPLCEVETAKAAVELPSPYAGTVTELLHEVGTTVEVGAPIITIDVGGTAPDGRTSVLVGYGPRTAETRRRPRRSVAGTPVPPAPPPPRAGGSAAPEASPAAPAGTRTAGHRAARPLAKPPVRKYARDLGVDLSGVPGTGPSGTVTRSDVDAVLAADPPVGSAVAGSGPAGAGETRVPVRGVRRHTAAAMVASAFTAPHVTEFLTVDVTRMTRLRARLAARPEFAGVKLSPLLFAARAVALAARRHPVINSSWDEAAQEIVVFDQVNLGIAAATPRGLVVPTIKDAGRLTLPELAAALAGLTRTAREGRTAPADLAGGTITITNVGVFGVDTGTPILVPGQSAILALGAVRPMPWVHKGRVRVRQVTTLALSFDHRVVDGELGSRFLADVGTLLHDPATVWAF